MEEYTTEEQETKSTEVKRWFQDNLRIIISIAIVVAIAGGIYSYSKRAESPSVTDQSVSTEKTDQSENPVEVGSQTDENKSADQASAPKKEEVAAPASQETENAFVETAGKGDSATRLARRALANYLEKNPDSALTKEHKIYIEDLLRKQQPHKGVRVGTTMEFSKDMVQKAIEQSKNLNERQLKNLQKFSVRVTTL